MKDFRLAIFSETYPPQLNGVARTLERLTRAVRERGGAVRIFTTTDPAAVHDPDICRLPSIPFWAYPQLRLSAPSPRAAMRALDGWQPTLVHAATPFGLGLTGRAVALRCGVPFVSSYHTNFSDYARYYHLGILSRPCWRFMRWFHNSGARTFCPTRAVRAELESRGFRHVAVWGRGVDANRFSPSYRAHAMRERLGVGENDQLVIYVGRLALEKGLDVAIDAMHHVRSRGVATLKFALAGDGPYERECHKRAPDGTVFMGRITGDELSAFYAAGDIFIFPSVTDTFGNVLVEAMASGLAIIGADSAPTRELLGDGLGITFPAGDGAALARSIIELSHDQPLRARLAVTARRFAEQCTWTGVFDRLMTDYHDVLRQDVLRAAK